MKLFVVAVIIGVCAADRLDNKYLPPRGNAGAGYQDGFGVSAGGSGFKAAGGFGSGGFRSSGSGFGGSGSGFGGSGSGFGHSGAGSGFGGAGTQHAGNIYNAAPQQYSGNQQYNARSNSADASAQILRQNSDVTADGFSYDFETSNGIRADASGVATNGVQSQGSFAYKGDDGQDYSITYTADENGYQPQGAHLPTPPPIPEAILKSLEQNARDEAAGISDDGTYRGEGAGGAGGYSAGYSGQSGAPSSQYGAPSGQSAGPSGQYGAPSRGFGAGSSGSRGFGGGSSGSSNFGSGSAEFGARQSNFGAAASRQYLAPNAGPRGSGSGNFNSQTGYRY